MLVICHEVGVALALYLSFIEVYSFISVLVLTFVSYKSGFLGGVKKKKEKRKKNQRVNQGDASISASIDGASSSKGNRSFFLCLRLCLRRCVARVKQDNASISTRKQKRNHKLSAEVCPVFKLGACTSAILDLKFGAKF